MARTIQCVECGVVLNLPEHALGRRLKCPRCGARFVAGSSADTPAQPAPATPAGPDTTFELTRKASSLDLPVMPTAEGDLRETFDLSSMTGSEAQTSKSKASGGPKGAGASGTRQTSDALALFDDAPRAPRKKTGAEARATARRCPTCGGVVPVGMSICQTCGLDLETGTRVAFDDDLIPTPTLRSEGTPLLIAVIGGVCGALSVVLAVMAIVLWQKGVPGAQYFIPVAGFGVYASVRFFQLKTVKLLLIALTIGALVNIAAMIALPIYDANSEIPIERRTVASDDPDADVDMIKPITERLDTQRISTGVAILFLYAVTCIFLLSPTVQKHFRR
ncbi:MAG: hypothetical protein U0794_16400 [Isosphaeraceae bacterium]